MGVISDERKIIKFKINGAPRNILINFLGGKHPFSDGARSVFTYHMGQPPPPWDARGGARGKLPLSLCMVLLINMFFVIQPKSLLVISLVFPCY